MRNRQTVPHSVQLALFDDATGAVTVRDTSASPAPMRGAEPTPQAPAFCHPRANRELLLDGYLVAYVFRRARRRSIGFVVGAEGLSVAAPRWVALAEVEAALREKSCWIVAKLQEQRERQRRQQATRIAWGDGAVLPFLGRPVAVVLDARRAAR